MINRADLTQVSQYVYEIPQSFRSDMRVPARFYTNPALSRKFLLILLLAISLALGLQMARAQGPADPIWQAEYWNNRSLAGAPEIIRSENFIDYNWGDDSPDEDIADDNFSARWTANIDFEPAVYTFNATSDDGIRVWVDGDLIINAWDDHDLETFSARKNLGDGLHHIRVEYYEHEGGAIAQFWWAPAPPTGRLNWRGEYYDNVHLNGEPVVVRQDSQISFNWDGVPPAPGVGKNKFSARWTRTLNLPPGSYRFEITVDDGARLWVNGRLLINAWYVQSPRTYRGDIYLPGGPVPLQMEYFNNLGGAIAQLSWSRAPLQTRTWRGEYYNRLSFAGAPALVRNEPVIDFNWGQGSPAASLLGADRFAARWTRTLDLPAGRYRFVITVDDGARLWIDDRLLIDAWRVQSPTRYSADIELTGQPVSVRMEYFENTGGAVAQLSWTRLEVLAQISGDGQKALPLR